MDRPTANPTSQRGRLSRQVICEAALEILSSEGVERLTMRRLAERLGVEAMSLYNHVKDKKDLLEGVVGLVVSRIERPDPARPWRERLEAVVLGLYEALSAHPGLVMLLATEKACLSDPQAVVGMEIILAILEEAGLGPAHRVSAMRGMLAMCFGLVLNHTLGLTASPAEAEAQWQAWDPAALEQSGLPQLGRLARQFLITRPRDDLRFMLDAYLDGVERAGRPPAAETS
jgi:AcrR family transcriptional regulator